MKWLIFALLAYLFWAVCNIIGKVLLTKHVRNSLVYVIFVGIAGLLPLLSIPFKSLVIPPAQFLITTLITGMLYIYALIPYFQALSIEEVSRVIPLWRFTPLFVLIFSIGFVGEQLGFYEIIAFFLLLFGGILISVKRLKETFKLSKALYFMMFSSFLLGIYHTLTKFVYLNLSYYDGFILIRFGSFIGALSILVIKKYRISLIEIFSSINAKIKGIILCCELLNLICLALFNFAVSIGSVSLISASAAIQSIFVLLLASMLSVKSPQILKEEMSTKIVLQKLIAIILIVMGAGIIILY